MHMVRILYGCSFSLRLFYNWLNIVPLEVMVYLDHLHLTSEIIIDREKSDLIIRRG